MKTFANQKFVQIELPSKRNLNDVSFDNCVFNAIDEGRSGKAYANIKLTRCSLNGFWGNSVNGKTNRTCENFRVKGLKLDRVNAGNTIFRKCVFEDVRGALACAISGAVFDRCRVEGSWTGIRVLCAYNHDISRLSNDLDWWRKEYATVDWALDISAASFPTKYPNEVSFVGVPGEKIIRNPGNSIIWRNALAGQVDPKKLGLKCSLIVMLIRRAQYAFEKESAGAIPFDGHDNFWEYQVVVNCGVTKEEIRAYDRDFERLCKAGIAFRENPVGVGLKKSVRRKK